MKIIIILICIINLNLFSKEIKVSFNKIDKNNNTILLITPRIKFNYKKDKNLRSVIRKLCGCKVKTAFYKYVSDKMIKNISPFAIIIGGQNTPWRNYKEKNLSGVRNIILNSNIPILGICGGHQLIASTYNGRVGWINDKYTDKRNYKNCRRLKGYIRLDSFLNDKIFMGIDLKSKFLTKHCEVVKKNPTNFTVLAAYKGFIYTIKHNKKLIYGTQFHPEGSKAGRIVLKNFIKMAKKYRK
jgi:GMP synthase (glutamine-hydrolysing)